MIVRFRPLRVVPVLLASSLLLSSCGGGDSPAEPDVSVPTVASVRVVSGALGDVVVGSSVTVEVAVADGTGAPMAGVTVRFTAGAGGSASPTSAATGADGKASTTWTLGTTAGTQTLQAAAGGISASASANAVPDVAAQLARISGDAQSGAAGEALPEPLVVEVQDRFGNARSGEDVTVAVTAGGGSVSTTGTTTGSDGRVSLTWTLGTAVGGDTLQVTHAVAGTVTFTALTVPGDPAQMTPISGGGDTLTVGTQSANPVTVELQDAFGNLVPGVPVAFVVTGGGGSVGSDTVVTGADGRATTAWTVGGTAGQQTLEARVSGVAAVVFTSFAVAGPAAELRITDGDGQSGTVASTLPTALAVEAVDGFGNPVSGVQISFTVTGGGGSVDPVQATSTADGRASASWTLGQTAGSQTLEAAAQGLTAVTFSATATPDAPAEVRVASGDGQTGTVAEALASPVVARVVDRFGNAVPGAVVTFAAGGGGSVDPATDTTDAAGEASTTWTMGTTSGTQSLTASVAGATQATFQATATAGAPTSLSLVSGDGQQGPAGGTLAEPLVVAVRDTFANGVPGVAVAFAVTSGGGSVSASSVTTGADGTASANFTLGPAVGTHTAEASVSGLGSVSFTATASSGPPASITKVIGDGDTVSVGSGVTVTVEVTDAFANKVPGATVAFTVTGGGGSVSASSALRVAGPQAAATSANAVTGSDGRASATWTMGTAPGTNTLSAVVDGLSGVTFTATGETGPAATLAKVAGDNQSATVGTAVATPPKVKVTDAFGNPVGGVSVTFAVASGGGSVTGGSQTTAADGTAAVGGWTLGSAAGTNTLTASSPGLTAVTFTATGTAADNSYNIEVRFLTSASSSVQAAVTAAETRWEQVVTGDVPDALLNAKAGSCEGNEPAINETIDDVVIYFRVDSIDGVGQILGQARPCWIRNPSNLTLVGTMTFDEADLANMQTNGTLTDVILHEMGHVLGIGGTIWDNLGVIQGAGTTDPYFSGARAIAAYQGLGGVVTNGVPVENTGGSGTADSPWRETVFDNELMTGYISGPNNPLSTITVESLADLGYTVDSGAADSYALPAGSPAARAERTRQPPWEKLLKPRGTVTPRGTTRRIR